MNSVLADSSQSKPHFSLPSLGAVICAVVSFATHSAALGFAMAVLAIILGVLGFIIALLPGVRGGLVSIISFAAGALGIIVALFRLIGHAVN